MGVTTTYQIGLKVEKETIVRRTEFIVEETPREHEIRMAKGKHERTAVIEEPFDFSHPAQRKELFRMIIDSMSDFSFASVKEAEGMLIDELKQVVNEIDDELPFH